MSVTLDYKKEIINLTNKLPEDKLKELIDFARSLKSKNESFSYAQIEDSAEYVKKLRIKEGKTVKSGKKFIEELIEWQKSNS